jgi:hypothetical protein
VTVNEVPALFAVMAKVEAADTVPRAAVCKKIRELAVTALLETTVVADPPKVNVPAEQVAEEVAGITNLFPAVLITRFPLVAVMFPDVAVIPVPPVKVVPDARVVVVVSDPGVVIAEGRETTTAPVVGLAVT